MFDKVLPSVDSLKLPLKGQKFEFLSLSKLLGANFGVYNLPANANLHQNTLQDKDITSQPQNSPSESSRLYVAGVLHRLVESGDIPESLSPIARKIYSSDRKAGNSGALWVNFSDRKMFRSRKTVATTHQPLGLGSRPHSASPSHSKTSSRSPGTPSQFRFHTSPAITAPDQSYDSPASTSKTRAIISTAGSQQSELRATLLPRDLQRPGSPALPDPPRCSVILLSAQDALAHSFFSKVLPPDCMRILAQGCHLLDCKAGKVLALQGRRCDAAYVIVDGELVAHEARPGPGGEGHTRAEVDRVDGLGDCVSEAAVLTGAAAPHTVQCATPCRLVRVPVVALQAVIRHAPHAANLLAVSSTLLLVRRDAGRPGPIAPLRMRLARKAHIIRARESSSL